MLHLATIGSGSIVDLFLDAVEKTEGIALEAAYSRTKERAVNLRKSTARRRDTRTWTPCSRTGGSTASTWLPPTAFITAM